MNQNLSGLYKIAGISLLLVLLWVLMAFYTPESFLKPNNIENLMRRTALYGVLGIGVAFVIITAGIDLSIGSVVCFSGCLLALLLQVTYQPMHQLPVTKIEASESRVTMSRETDRFSVGDMIRYDGGRRARDLVAQVTDIQQSTSDSGEPVTVVTVDKTFTRDDDTGRLTRLIPLQLLSEGETNGLTIAERIDSLASKDQLWFVHPEKGLLKRKIESVKISDVNMYVDLDETIKLDSQWRVIPLRRTSVASVPVALVVVLGAGLLLGLIHGLLITKLNLQPFVVTLCSLLIFRSVSRRMVNDQMVGFGGEYPSLQQFGSGKLMIAESPDWSFGIPFPFFVLIIVAIAAGILLNFTIWGRYMQALGRNEEAARYSGVNTQSNKILAYMICTFLAALGGIMFALDANSIAPYSFGNFFELYAIAAAVLGGCSLRGGEGSILGVIVGTALMQTLYNMIVLWKISAQLELAIVGIVILLGVVADELLRRVTRR